MSEWEVVSENKLESNPSEWEVVSESPVSSVPEKPKEEGFFSRVGSDIKKRFDTMTAPENYGRTFEERALRTGGQIAGMANDVIGQGLKSAYNTLVPKATQNMFSEGAKNVADYYAKPIQSVTEGYGAFKELMPEVAKNVEAIANIAGFLPMGKGAYEAGKVATNVAKEGMNIASDVALATGKSAEQQVDSAIKRGVEKAIRPQVAGKRTDPQIKQYYQRATDAVKNIISNRDNLVLTTAEGDIVRGELPQSLNQFSEAIDQTKKSVFKQYDELANQAGDKGIKVELKGLSDELAKIGTEKVTQIVSPEVSKHALFWNEQLKKVGSFTAEETQDAISQLNKGLEAFYKNPTYEGATKAGIDAIVVGKLRSSLDKAITEAVGEGYQGLKNSYGSLKTIEKEVAQRAIVDSRKNIKGLIDFTDIFTYGEFLAGLGTLNPALIMKSVTQKGVKEYMKHTNNPNNIVKGMFGEVDNILKRDAEGFKSKAFQSVEGKFGENPLSADAVPSVPNVPYYFKKTNVPSTDVKSGTLKGEPYGHPSSKWQKPPMQLKELPAGQGFSLSGEPYTPDVIDAIFTAKSRPIPEIPVLDIPRRDATLALPAGGQFVLNNPSLKRLRDYQKALKR